MTPELPEAAGKPENVLLDIPPPELAAIVTVSVLASVVIVTFDPAASVSVSV